MPQKITKNTFIRGMNLDADISNQPQGTCREIEEFRVTVDDTATFGTLSNVKGNTDLNLGFTFNETILGSTVLEDYLVLFVNYTDIDGAIVLANDVKAKYNAHCADTSDHTTAADTVNVVTASDATDLDTLIVLLVDLISKYKDHDNDAELDSGWAYHAAEEEEDHSLLSLTAPSTTMKCVSVLHDIKAKYNSHDADTTAHGVGNAHQVTIDDITTIYDNIYKVSFNNENASKSILYTDQGKALSDSLNLDTDYPIKAVSRKETDILEKVYWVDGNNSYLRYANVSEHLTTDGEIFESGSNEYVSASTFSTMSDVIFAEPELITSSGGGLNVGMVQYAYQLFNKNGAETVFSPATGLYHLSSSSDSASDSGNYEGNPVEDESGKSLTFTLDLDTYEYDSIRVVSIHYEYYQQLPTINIITEKAIGANGIVTFTDRGTGYIGSYTIEQFTTIAGLYKAKDIASSKNYLFLANVTESYFDIDNYDARVYRFNKGVTKEFRGEEDNTNVYFVETDGTWKKVESDGTPIIDGINWTVPETADLTNPYNDTVQDVNTRSDTVNTYLGNFKYDAAGNLGGTGKNISLTFGSSDFVIDDNTYAYTLKTQDFATDDDANLVVGFDGYYSPYNTANRRSYQRDEVYRFGIVFFDVLGRQSVVRWIADIRMPNLEEYPIASRSVNDNKVTTLYPIFTIATYPEGAISYKIVRTLREAEDKSIVFSGLLRPTAYVSASASNQPYHKGGDLDTPTMKTNLQELISPEISFYKDFSVINNDYLQVNDLDDSITWDVENDVITTTAAQDMVVKYREIDYYGSYKTTTLYDGQVVGPLEAGETVNINGITFNSFFNEQNGDEEGYKGTSLILGGTNNSWEYTGGLNTDNLVKHAMYRRHVYGSQYGGSNYSARTNSEYVGCSPTIDTTQEGVEVTYETVTTYSYETRETEVYLDSLRDDAEFISLDIVNDRATLKFLLPEDYRDLTDVVTGAKPVRLVIDYDGTRPTDYDSKDSGDTISVYDWSVLGNYLTVTVESSGDICDESFFVIGSVQISNLGIQYTKTITTTTVVTVTTPTPIDTDATQGDVFIGYMDHTALYYVDETRGVFVDFLFPVETSINLALRHDDHFTTVFQALPQSYKDIREEGNVDTDYSELYLYNTVFSQENTLKQYYPRPYDEEPVGSKLFNTRVIVSEKKFNGESSDSWLSFLVNNFIDVDANHGEVINIMDYSNNLLYWQPRAFGFVDVDPRSLITDNNPGALVLGTGAVLSRFDYLSTMTGNSDMYGLTKTSKGIYWYDNVNQTIVRYNGKSIERLSKLFGLQSHLNDNAYTSSYTGFDSKYDEVLFTLRGSTNTTLVFNELINAFTGFYNMEPTRYIQYNERLISTADNFTLYLHDSVVSTYGVYYDNAVQDGTIKLPINPEIDVVKIFDGINYTSYSYNNDILNFEDTFESVRCYNSYQNSDTITLTPGTNLERKKGLWSFHVPRNAVNANPDTNPDIFDAGNLDTTQTFKTRIRDTYMIMDLVYDNSSNYKFNVPFVHTKYRANYR